MTRLAGNTGNLLEYLKDSFCIHRRKLYFDRSEYALKVSDILLEDPVC